MTEDRKALLEMRTAMQLMLIADPAYDWKARVSALIEIVDSALAAAPVAEPFGWVYERADGFRLFHKAGDCHEAKLVADRDAAIEYPTGHRLTTVYATPQAASAPGIHPSDCLWSRNGHAVCPSRVAASAPIGESAVRHALRQIIEADDAHALSQQLIEIGRAALEQAASAPVGGAAGDSQQPAQVLARLDGALALLYCVRNALEYDNTARKGGGWTTWIEKIDAFRGAAREALPPSEQADSEAAQPTVQAGAARVTDEMVTAYLNANDAYWREVDGLSPEKRSAWKWRNGTPKEATRVSLEAALKLTPPAPQEAQPAPQQVEAPTFEELEALADQHQGHPADFAADVLERWGGWPTGLLGHGGALDPARRHAKPSAQPGQDAERWLHEIHKAAMYSPYRQLQAWDEALASMIATAAKQFALPEARAAQAQEKGPHHG